MWYSALEHDSGISEPFGSVIVFRPQLEVLAAEHHYLSHFTIV